MATAQTRMDGTLGGAQDENPRWPHETVRQGHHNHHGTRGGDAFPTGFVPAEGRIGLGASPAVCFALFRRALAERDEHTWAAIYQGYGALVRTWSDRVTDDPSEAEDLVPAAFTRLWRAVDATRFARFPDLNHLLQYLKLCVYTAALDRRRARALHARALSLDQVLTQVQEERRGAEPAADDDVEGELLDAEARRDFWDAIRGSLHDRRAVLLLRLSYVEALPPREVCRRAPEHFPTVETVYQLKSKVLEHLRHSPAMQTWRVPP